MVQPTEGSISRNFYYYRTWPQERYSTASAWSNVRWGREKIPPFHRRFFQNAFTSGKSYELRSRFHWSLFLLLELTIFLHWFKYWLGVDQVLDQVSFDPIQTWIFIFIWVNRLFVSVNSSIYNFAYKAGDIPLRQPLIQNWLFYRDMERTKTLKLFTLIFNGFM